MLTALIFKYWYGKCHTGHTAGALTGFTQANFPLRYTDGGQDVVLFTSPNIEYKVDAGGQFCPDYYGMKFELIECIHSEQVRSLSQICFPYCFTLDQKLDISFSQYISSYVIKNQSKSLCDLADFFF